MPSSAAFRAAASAATWAAKGVPLREPLKPTEPALDHTITFPWGSVIVMIVLLKVEWMWTTPSDTIRFAFLRRAGAASGVAGRSPAASGCFAIGPPHPFDGAGLLPAIAPPRVYAGLGADLVRGAAADPVDVGECDLHTLLVRQVDARDTCHPLRSPSPDAACAAGSGRGPGPPPPGARPCTSCRWL